MSVGRARSRPARVCRAAVPGRIPGIAPPTTGGEDLSGEYVSSSRQDLDPTGSAEVAGNVAFGGRLVTVHTGEPDAREARVDRDQPPQRAGAAYEAEDEDDRAGCKRAEYSKQKSSHASHLPVYG